MFFETPRGNLGPRGSYVPADIYSQTVLGTYERTVLHFLMTTTNFQRIFRNASEFFTDRNNLPGGGCERSEEIGKKRECPLCQKITRGGEGVGELMTPAEARRRSSATASTKGGEQDERHPVPESKWERILYR